MSDATIEDFQARLEQAGNEFRSALAQRKAKVLTQMSARGALLSSMTVMQLLSTLNEGVNEYVVATRTTVCEWSKLGAVRLSDLKRSATLHLRDEVAQAVKPAFVEIGRGGVANSMRAPIDEELKKITEAAEIRIRELELGIGLDGTSALPPGTVFNVIHAGSVTGGIQQGTTSSHQANTVILTTVEIGAALDRLEKVLSDRTLASLRDEIAGDLATIRAQLQKTEPSHGILREAGATIKRVLEGAVGGAAGNAATPAVTHAAMSLGVALGL